MKDVAYVVSRYSSNDSIWIEERSHERREEGKIFRLEVGITFTRVTSKLSMNSSVREMTMAMTITMKLWRKVEKFTPKLLIIRMDVDSEKRSVSILLGCLF